MDSGVYTIRQIGTDRVYVGSSAKVKYRLAQHLKALRCGKHHAIFLQRAFDKHGEAAFESSLLEACEIELLITREQFYIDTLNSCFNSARHADAPSRGVSPSAETRAKLSASSRGRKHTAEAKAKISAAHKGKIHSPEHLKRLHEMARGRKPTAEQREKMRAAGLLREWKPETCAKISAALKGKKRPMMNSGAGNAKRAAWRASLSPNSVATMREKKSASLRAMHAARTPEQQTVISRKIADANRGKAVAQEMRDRIAATLGGSRHDRGKLSEMQIQLLIARRQAGETFTAIAKDMGVRKTSTRAMYLRRMSESNG